jgi:exosome complex RNA-binding protein Rrp42 (RNase PH superfamily)
MYYVYIYIMLSMSRRMDKASFTAMALLMEDLHCKAEEVSAHEAQIMVEESMMMEYAMEPKAFPLTMSKIRDTASFPQWGPKTSKNKHQQHPFQ